MTSLKISAVGPSLHMDSRVPPYIHLVPVGTFSGTDGRGPYTLRDPQAVIRASLAAGKIPVDENHATDFAIKSGIPRPARGWIDAMEVRPDGIWGHVDWTPSGAGLLADMAYRGISPVFEHDTSGLVQRVMRAALTNAPNLPQLATLHGRNATASAAPGAAAGIAAQSKQDLRIYQIMGVDPARVAMQGQVPAPAAPEPARATGLTQEDEKICWSMNIPPQKYAALKAKMDENKDSDELTADEVAICKRANIDPKKVMAKKKSDREAQALRDFTHNLSFKVTDDMMTKPKSIRH